jgi:hypothetical protein
MKRQGRDLAPTPARLRRRRSNHAESEWLKSCFVLEVAGRPVLAFSAASMRAAKARAKELWFVEELGQMRSGGRPILCDGDDRSVRQASVVEAAQVELYRRLDDARGEDIKYCFAFLIAVDPTPN